MGGLSIQHCANQIRLCDALCRDSPHFTSFLEADDYGFAAAKAQTKLASSSESTASTVDKWFGWAKQAVKESEAFTALAGVAGVAVPNSERVSTSRDAEFERMVRGPADSLPLHLLAHA